jgi:hypothetical protein
VTETEVDEVRVAFRDFIRRIGLLTRRGHQLEPGGRAAQPVHRQPGGATVAMGSSSAAHEPATAAHPAPARLPVESASEKPTVIARRAPVHAFEAPQAPPMAEAAPGREVAQTDREPAPRQPVAGGGVDPLAATRVVPAAGEKPLGQVLGVLVAVEGELEGAIRPIQRGSTRLGRHPECEVFLPSEWISRQHARIEYQHGIFAIEASSDKPTLVNSERVVGSELHDGDYIKLGKTTLRFRSIL